LKENKIKETDHLSAASLVWKAKIALPQS